MDLVIALWKYIVKDLPTRHIPNEYLCGILFEARSITPPGISGKIPNRMYVRHLFITPFSIAYLVNALKLFVSSYSSETILFYVTCLFIIIVYCRSCLLLEHNSIWLRHWHNWHTFVGQPTPTFRTSSYNQWYFGSNWGQSRKK